MIEANDPLALAWYTRKNCGNGDQLRFLGSNMSEMEGYETKSIEDLLVAENSESIGLGRKRSPRSLSLNLMTVNRLGWLGDSKICMSSL